MGGDAEGVGDFGGGVDGVDKGGEEWEIGGVEFEGDDGGCAVGVGVPFTGVGGGGDGDAIGGVDDAGGGEE